MLEKLLIPFSIVLAGLIIAAANLLSSGTINFAGWSAPQTTSRDRASVGQNLVTPPPASDQSSASAPAAPVVGREQKVDPGTNPVLGKAEAPVAVVEFGDYQCPYCGKFFKEIEPRLKKDFIETGKVKFAYRDFAFLGPESKDAALGSRCAAAQGQYWAYHDQLFKNQNGENRGAFSPDNLKKFAKDLKLNLDKFNRCLDLRTFDAEVQKDVEATRSLGVNGTPTLFVNGQVFYDWTNYPALKSSIEDLL